MRGAAGSGEGEGGEVKGAREGVVEGGGEGPFRRIVQ